MKRPNMKKVPSALKWLAEKRARIAGELLSCTQTIAHLEGDSAELKNRLTFVEQAITHAEVHRERLTLELSSFDQVVQSYDKRINPSDIEPTNDYQRPISSHTASYVDKDTNDLFLTYRTFEFHGGYLRRGFLNFGSGSTSCGPKNYRHLSAQTHLDELLEWGPNE